MNLTFACPVVCRFLGRPARRRRLGTGLQASEKRQGTKSRGGFQVYGDLTGAAMMAALAVPDFGDHGGRSGWGWGEVARLPGRSRDDLADPFGR